MNYRELQGFLSHIAEIRPLGKTARVRGLLRHAVGLVRYHDKRMALLMLSEMNGPDVQITHTARPLSSRRALLRRNVRDEIQRQNAMPSMFISQIRIGDLLLDSSGNMGQRMDGCMAALLGWFLRAGWDGSALNNLELEQLHVSFAEINGEWDAIPDFDASLPIRFSERPSRHTGLVERSLTLRVGDRYPDKLCFADKLTHETYWLQINEVSLIDPWKELEGIFKNIDPPRQKEFQKALAACCPQGMQMPYISYECDPNLVPQFYTKQALSTPPSSQIRSAAYSFGFSIRNAAPTGKLGMSLRQSPIEGTVPPGTSAIKAELFSYTLAVSRRPWTAKG